MFWLHLAAATLLAVLMFMTVIDVARRTIAGKALVGVVEISQFLMVGIVFLSLAYAQRQNKNIRVDMLVTRLSGKRRIVLEVIMLLLFAGFAGLITWQGGLDFLHAWRIGEWEHGPGNVSLYTWPARLTIPVGCFWLFVQLIIDIVRYSRGYIPEVTKGGVE